MPRKRQSIPILRIELMSTGQEYRPATGVVDDWGQPIVQPKVDGPINPLPSADEIIDKRRREKAANQRLLLQAVGILPMPEQTVPIAPKLVAKHIPGKRVIGVMDGSALYVVMPAWRRV